ARPAAASPRGRPDPRGVVAMAGQRQPTGLRWRVCGSCTCPLRINIADSPSDRHRGTKASTRGLSWPPSSPFTPGDARTAGCADTPTPRQLTATRRSFPCSLPHPCAGCGHGGTRNSSTSRRVVYLSAADNCLAPKTGYNAPRSSHWEGAFYHDSTSILLSARGLGTPVAVCHATPRLAQPRRDDPDQASQAHHAAPPALHRPQTLSWPHPQASLCGL